GYSITKPFPRKYRYFLLAFVGFSATAFIIINVFLVGYEVISVSTPDFNSTHAAGLPLWQSESESSNSGCYPHQFQLGDTFRTNLSAFSYSIFDVESAAGVSPVAGGFLYSNEVISVCDVDQYEIAVKPGDRLISVTATVQCPSPLGFRAVTSWSYSNHGILGMEAYEDIYNKLYTTNEINGMTGISQEIYTVLAEGQPNCDTSPPFSCVVPPFSWYNAIGNTDLNILPGPADVAADELNLYNVINVFYAAVRLDLGHWTADNVISPVYSNLSGLIFLSRCLPTPHPSHNWCRSHVQATAPSAPSPQPKEWRTPTSHPRYPRMCPPHQL
ncbi:hypothetical protein K438DRAFT_1818682, partial [Mycena galopus ATCC 62051]